LLSQVAPVSSGEPEKKRKLSAVGQLVLGGAGKWGFLDHRSQMACIAEFLHSNPKYTERQNVLDIRLNSGLF
jgi:hypothetical protein